MTAEVVAVNEQIGARVRQHRTARGWTLEDLADRSGVSRRMLITIEHGEGNPSIATLLRISDALGVGLPVLVDVERPHAVTVTAAGRAPVLWRGPLGGQALLVAGTEPPDVVELWDWTLQPGEAHTTEAHSAGTRELLLVLAGEVDLRVGDRTERLGVGDSVTFAGDVAHGYAAPAGATTPARFALTVFQPGVGGGRR
jgi:transcriptional regulator with XRE-family HTH domain